ncbi:type IV pilin protein [Massilia niastensis]|uniref:type IV pilin protein n=1 Tax=Massilia niastensis TaxID=544911 RepID=UPI0003709C9D|nr:type IV pilin protein [Massilia niastensis]
MQQRQSGFSLIEIMIGVVIIGILTAVALPSYTNYVMRARLAEAHSALAAVQPRLEQFWSNNRSFADFDAEGVNQMPADTENFAYTLEDASASGYTVIATGRAAAADFVYTIDQAGNRATTKVPEGWAKNDNCWVDRKGGLCTE